MSFSTKKIQPKKSKILNITGIIAIIIIFLLGFLLINKIDFQNIKIPEQNTTSKYEILEDLDVFQESNQSTSGIYSQSGSKKPDEEQKVIVRTPDKNKINILLLGRGGGSHDAPNLTDTLILVHADIKKKQISMLSIPRDLYVDYPNDTSGKINGLFATIKTKHDSEDIGMQVLSRKISQITGEKIDYYVNVDFEGFTKTIDAIGGIDLTIPRNFVDEQYPDGSGGYRTLIFKKGTWNFDGNSALNYARSRHSTSDFDRSLRQQEVIKALKEKLTAGFFLSSPKKISKLYDIFTKNVKTNLKLSDVLSIGLKINKNDDYKIYSSNLNDSCFYGSNTCAKGGFLYIPSRDLFHGMSVLLIDETDIVNLNSYHLVKSFTQLIFHQNEIFEENYKIGIFNSLKVNNLAGSLFNRVKRYGFNIPNYLSIGNTPTVYKKSVIYYNNIDLDSQTIKYLKTIFAGEFIQTPGPKYSKDNAKIEIVLGEDYLKNPKIFNF